MKTIALDLEKDQQLDVLSTLIGKENIELGREKFQLKIHTDNTISNTLYASFLLLLARYFSDERSKWIHKHESSDMEIYTQKGEYYYKFYIKNHDVGKLENKIEKDFKIDIELEWKNSIDDVFGIWKNQNINLDQIREKAWQRTK